MTKGICCISFSFFLITILLLCTKRSDADSNEFLLFTNKPPKNTTVELGGSHSFTCTSNKDGVFTKWYKNIDLEKIFEPYFDLDDYKLESQGNNKSTLKLRNISHDDQGWYSCLMEAITDNEMRINASFYLTVKDPNRNLNNDLTNTIVKILETFDDASLKNALASWNYYEYEPDVRGEVNNHQDELTTYRFLYIVKYETSDLRSDNITCIFHDSLQVNTFQYKKIKARGSFTYKSSNGSISRKGFFEVHIMNADISTKLIIRNTPQMGLDCNTSMTHEEITTVFWFMDDYRLKRKIRVDLGTQLSNSLITMVNNLIGNLIKISIRPMLSICKEPLQIIKMSLPEFDKQLLENLYYFAIDRGWIDIPKLVNRSQVVDVLVQGLSNIKSIHVSYPDWINGDIVHELRMENLKGNLIWVQYSTELTELSFEIDFILLTVKKTKNKINEVRIKAGTFSVVPVTSNVSSLTGNQNAHIKEEFELLAADFLYEKISGDFTTRFKNTNSTENTSLQQSQFYLFDDRNIGESLARAIAKILQSFHKDAMQSIKKYANKKIKNQEHFSQLEISATIFNVQEEICDFTNLIKVKYDDVWIELKGIILGSNNSKSHDREFENIPFVVNINSLAISRQRNSAECLANIDGNDKTVFLNSTTYRNRQNDKQNFKNEILKFLQSESGKMDNHTQKFSYDLCMNPETTIGVTKDILVKYGSANDYYYRYGYYYGVMSNLIDTTFHIPVKVNEVKVYGLWNFASINTTKVNDGTIFRLVINNLKFEIDWQYYTGGSYLTKQQEMEYKANFIELTGKINENGTQLEFTNDSRLMLIMSRNPSSPIELITMERVKNKINETIISLIQNSIKEAYGIMK